MFSLAKSPLFLEQKKRLKIITTLSQIIVIYLPYFSQMFTLKSLNLFLEIFQQVLMYIIENVIFLLRLNLKLSFKIYTIILFFYTDNLYSTDIIDIGDETHVSD